jgi:hypothetical protein
MAFVRAATVFLMTLLCAFSTFFELSGMFSITCSSGWVGPVLMGFRSRVVVGLDDGSRWSSIGFSPYLKG